MVLKISWVMISKVLLLGFKSFLDDTCRNGSVMLMCVDSYKIELKLYDNIDN
jgi:hypothetical protein